MVRNFTTALVAALVLGSAGIASARAPSIGVDLSAERGAVLLSAQLALRTITRRNKVTRWLRRWEASTKSAFPYTFRQAAPAASRGSRSE
jgi:hypothetical protein